MDDAESQETTSRPPEAVEEAATDEVRVLHVYFQLWQP